MGYHSYLVERFETTHENKFFRKLNELFSQTYSEIEGKHIFIGNVGVGGHALDAIFIKRGTIIVIDFKDYSGTLTYSENGPWKITDGNDRLVFVAGGAKSRNPFQQVKAYRFSLFPFLAEHEAKILDTNHSVSWEHTNAMVLFQREITFDENEIPAKIQRYFHVIDVNNIINRFSDCYSANLELTDSEIDNILNVLNIGSDSLYSQEFGVNEEEINVHNPIDPARMDRIKQLIPDVSGKDKFVRSVAFYYTMIAIERINESSVSDVHPFPINWKECDLEGHLINIENHSQFYSLFSYNQNQNFPKNLFVSVNLLMDNITVPLFYTVVLNSEIDDLRAIKVNLNSFILFRQVLSELNLTEDTIEELSALINSADGLYAKITTARDYLGVSLELTEDISIGLSSESFYTSQLQSELRQIFLGKVPLKGDLFKSFISGNEISYSENEIEEEIIQITPLNPSQKKSVDLCFKQPLSVITGPPGTGKSQVVINILANAVIRSKKVLFASKNNQAVDVVYKRINELLNTKYFIRLGAKGHIEEFNSILQSLMQRKENGEFPNLSEDLNNQRNELNSINSQIKELKLNLKLIPTLKKNIANTNLLIIDKKEAHQSWVNSLNENYYKLFIDNNQDISISNVELNIIENKLINGTRNFFGKLNYRLFHKSKVQKEIVKLNSSLPSDIKDYVDLNSPYISSVNNEKESFLINVRYIKSLKEKRSSICNKNETNKSEIQKLEIELDSNKKDLTYSLENKEDFKLKIEALEKGLESHGIKLLGLSINESVRLADLQYIDAYWDYLNNEIPWRNDEKDDFRKVASEFLNIFQTISITNLSVKKAFLLDPEIFDIVVIDEASQCDIASALPMIYRAKNVVVIGDPWQLPHITSIQKHEQNFVLEKLGLSTPKFNYVDYSLFDHSQRLSNRSRLASKFLVEHYRCHPEIIEFSNRFFYKRKAGQELTLRTKEDSFHFGSPGLHWIDVKGKTEVRNVNSLEVSKCIDLVIQLSSEYPEASIGIVTPFRHQKEALLQAMKDIPRTDNIVCDTVHRYQGDEKDIMILSLVVTDASKPSLAKFINIYSPYLLNVAVTRARSALYIVGNKSYCKGLISDQGRTLLCNLALYSETTSSYLNN